ncbi:hypothetical protein [Haloferula sp. A504]|uniref:hypothetical protein n=1 Tax=Haloferula sp. A504 TaxID=3373601 RepID=UPI0031C0E687|nr:hypothetical protein [Verrucomicrobiaceae bacterium E54]
MKRKSDRYPSTVGRLSNWLEASSPPYSLAVGATCGCDLARLERETCDALNRVRELQGSRFGWFGFEDIRHLSGQPGLRRFIVTRADLDNPRFHTWNDIEVVLRGLASLGGVVLGGQAAMDATHDLPNVCRVMLSRCDSCRESELSGIVDPGRCGEGQLVSEVIRTFLDWVTYRSGGRWEPRLPLAEGEDLKAIHASIRESSGPVALAG